MSCTSSCARCRYKCNTAAAQYESPAPVLKYKFTSPQGLPLERKYEGSAGADILSAYDYVIPAGGKQIVYTDVAVQPPIGTYVHIAGRSGMAGNFSIVPAAGICDRDYNGIVRIVLFNHGPTAYKVKRGDKVAQLICEKIETVQLKQVLHLDATVRGDHGFGSSGR